ncbi:hypothetical protein Lepto7375DRAFT_7275 [Leptolyngbya sp. PCC 7375]|nr:hypothetical protein Lepto7375DRAFT_7275 [Leptolyngbya sp. PCC 7375]
MTHKSIAQIIRYKANGVIALLYAEDLATVMSLPVYIPYTDIIIK